MNHAASRGVRSIRPAASGSAYQARHVSSASRGVISIHGCGADSATTLRKRSGWRAASSSGEAAPVVAGEVGLLDPERVEQGDHVVDEDVGLVGSGRRVGPAEAAQVGHDHPPDVGQPLDDAAPLVPVLRPAVEQQQRLAGACLGDVHAQAARLDEAVLDARDRWEVVCHAAASIRPMTSAAPCLESGSLRLPHFGDCTHDGQPLSHGHSEISRCASSTSASKAWKPRRVMPIPPGWPS